MIDALIKLISEKSWDSEDFYFSDSSQVLPILRYSKPSEIPGELSIYLICKHTKALKIEDFFLSIVKKKLIPSKPVEVISFHYTIRPSPGTKEKIFLAEAVIQIETLQDFATLQHYFPLFSQWVAQAIETPTYANDLLETETSHFDEKVHQAHRVLYKLSKKFPHRFDTEIFLELNRLVILSPREFKDQRSFKHMARLVCSLYLMEKELGRAVRVFPEKRHLQLRFIHTHLRFPFGNKPVVGLAIAIYLLDAHETFEEKHILHTIQKILPNIQTVKGSFYCYQSPQEEIRRLYVDLEKKDGSRISLEELRQLRHFLLTELKSSIEKLSPSMLMIRNEEEALKNILVLSSELNHLRDMPQVLISFERQTSLDLIFKVLIVRMMRKNTPSLKDSFRKLKGGVKWDIQRLQIVGYFLQKHPKEASIIHIHIPRDHSVLRADSSVNLYSARQKVVFFLEKAFGRIRDYNGGMIVKQSELLAEIKDHFKNIPRNKLELLEDCFYGITPVEMQAILPVGPTVKLFNLILDSLNVYFSRQEQYYYKTIEEDHTLFVVFRANQASIQEHLNSAIAFYQMESHSIVSTMVKAENSVCMGYIYKGCSRGDCKRFSQAVEMGIQKWFEEIQKQQTLKLSFRHLPTSLDPRLSGEQFSGIIFKMLYEGLMRIEKDGTPACAIAKSVSISKDLKRYTFKLRKCYWSDGTRVSAEDFEYAWKKILDPHFKTAFAYLFYPIKNARFAKEGLIPADQIGIRAPNKNTLIIDLEHPTPYFLELTAHAFYSPINHVLDKTHPNWPSREGDAYVCNGPFRMKRFHSNRGCVFVKNEKYWDAEKVQLETISISQTNAYTSLEMYQKDEIDWLGRPISPWEHFFDHHSQEPTLSGPPEFVYWCVLNSEQFPLNYPKIRQALQFALSRKEIIQSISYPVSPAFSPLPLGQSQVLNQDLAEDKILARQLFAEALQELGLEKERLPVFTFLHLNREVRKKIAENIIKEWEEVLGVQCRLESCAWSTLFLKLTQGDFQIAEMSWFSPINDPHYTLDAFKHKTNSVNFAKWENKEYQNLLDLAARELDPSSRMHYLAAAEKFLIEQAILLPIFYEANLCKKKPYLKEIYQRTGQIDFKWAYIERNFSYKYFQDSNLARFCRKNIIQRRPYEP